VDLPHDQHTFDEYLRWLHRSMRTHIKPSYTEDAINDDSEEDVIEDAYDIATREEIQPERAPLQRYVVRY
jgi:capsid portal protein